MLSNHPRAAARLTAPLAAAGSLALLAGCAAGVHLPAPVAPPPVVVTAPPPAPAPAPAVPLPAASAPAAPEASAPAAELLAYADRIRNLQPTELALEITRLGDPARNPLAQLQLALALSQTHVPADMARAQGLALQVVDSRAEAARPLQPLARLVAHRLGEQRRAEDELGRQQQQAREQQRRIDQLNDRLEAVRAVERSLAPRPAAGASRPGTP